MTVMMSPHTPLAGSSARPATSSTLRRKAVFSSARKSQQPLPLTPQQAAAIKAAADAELARERQLSDARLKSTWEHIFSKYGKDFEGIADEIDPITGDIIVDNGHLRGLSEDEGDVWDPRKRKRSESLEEEDETRDGDDLGFGKRRKTDAEVTGIDGGADCDKCKDKDDLDDTPCGACGQQLTAAKSPPAPAQLPNSAHRTPRVRSPTTKASNSSPSTSSPLSRLPNGFSEQRSSMKRAARMSSSAITIPDDEVDELSLPSPTPSRISTSVRQSSSTGKPKKSILASSLLASYPLARTSHRQVTVEIRTGPHASKKSGNKSPRTFAGESPRTRRKSPPPAKKPEKSPFKPVYGRSGHKPSSPLAFHPLPPSRLAPTSPRKLAMKSPAPKSSPPRSSRKRPPPTPVTPSDPWGRPPPEADPFYDSLWDDQHPDGIPVQFPPRPKPSAVFLTPAPPKAEKWGSRGTKPLGATTVKKRRETGWLDFLEEREKTSMGDGKETKENEKIDDIMNEKKDDGKVAREEELVPKAKPRPSLIDIYDVPDDSPEPEGRETVHSPTKAPLANGTAPLPKKCGDAGYHCGRAFCFSCIGDGEDV